MKKVYKGLTGRMLIIFSVFTFHFSLSIAQHYALYGITAGGGAHNDGLIYKYDPLTGQYDTLRSLDQFKDGRSTWTGLTLASNGLLYGVTEDGGSYGYGVMFSYNCVTKKDSVVIDFDSIHTGAYDVEGNSVMQAKNGLIYGTREVGGSYDSGVLFSYNIITGKDSVLLNFNKRIGAFPNCSVLEDTNTGLLYGTTIDGGKNGFGVIYCYNPLTNKDSVVFNYDSIGENGVWPKGNTFYLSSNGLFYGMTAYGGSPLFNGTLYSFNPKTNKDSTLVKFTGVNGAVPAYGNLMQATDNLLYGLAIAGGSNSNGVLFSFDPTNNKQTVLINFDGANGNEPVGDLVQDPENGLLYGITNTGGSNNMGVIFCYNLITGKDSVVHNFNGIDGSYPIHEPTLVKDTPNAINKLTMATAKVALYPNPNNGIFQLGINNYELGIKNSIEVYNMLGEKVYLAKLNSLNTQINLSNNADGVYMYRILNESGDLVSEGKFIIEK